MTIASAERQEVILDLARRAVLATDLQRVLEEATTLVADALRVDFADVLEARDSALVFRAGVGWNAPKERIVPVPADERAPAAQALRTNAPFVVEALHEARDLDPP